jgi:hypothetical protein
MSEPRTGMASRWQEDLESVVVKRYRFGTRQALLLSLTAFVAFALVNMMFALDQRAEPPGWLETNSTAPVLEARGMRDDPSSEISTETYDNTLNEPRANTQQPRTSWRKRQNLAALTRDLVAEAGRILERKAVNKAFAELDLNDRYQVRTFLLTYGRSRHAHEQGYTQAITRRALEADLYRTGEIIPCDKCWCWQSQPAHAGPPPLVD